MAEETSDAAGAVESKAVTGIEVDDQVIRAVQVRGGDPNEFLGYASVSNGDGPTAADSINRLLRALNAPEGDEVRVVDSRTDGPSLDGLKLDGWSVVLVKPAEAMAAALGSAKLNEIDTIPNCPVPQGLLDAHEGLVALDLTLPVGAALTGVAHQVLAPQADPAVWRPDPVDSDADPTLVAGAAAAGVGAGIAARSGDPFEADDPTLNPGDPGYPSPAEPTQSAATDALIADEPTEHPDTETLIADEPTEHPDTETLIADEPTEHPDTETLIADEPTEHPDDDMTTLVVPGAGEVDGPVGGVSPVVRQPSPTATSTSAADPDDETAIGAPPAVTSRTETTTKDSSRRGLLIGALVALALVAGLIWALTRGDDPAAGEPDPITESPAATSTDTDQAEPDTELDDPGQTDDTAAPSDDADNTDTDTDDTDTDTDNADTDNTDADTDTADSGTDSTNSDNTDSDDPGQTDDTAAPSDDADDTDTADSDDTDTADSDNADTDNSDEPGQTDDTAATSDDADDTADAGQTDGTDDTQDGDEELVPLDQLPERGAVFVATEQKLYLQGPVTAEEAAQLEARAIEVLGEEQVVNEYIIRPDAPPVTEGNVRVQQAVLFETGSAVIAEPFIPVLELAVRVMNLNPQVTMVVEGHTDSVGPDASNQVLSEARAQSVVNYLVGRGIDRGRLRPVGFGETVPIADNSTAQGRLLNRRIEVDLIDLLSPRPE